jgi:hypothetical protein
MYLDRALGLIIGDADSSDQPLRFLHRHTNLDTDLQRRMQLRACGETRA